MYAGVNSKYRAGNNPIAIDKHGIMHSVFSYMPTENKVYYTYSDNGGYTWSTPLLIYTVTATGMAIQDDTNFSVIVTPTHIHALGAIYKADNSGYVHSFRAIEGGEWTSTVMYAHSAEEHGMYNRLYTNETYGVRMPFWRHNTGNMMKSFNEGTLAWDAANTLNSNNTAYELHRISKVFSPNAGTLMSFNNANTSPYKLYWVCHNGTDWNSTLYTDYTDAKDNAKLGHELIGGSDGTFWIGYSSGDAANPQAKIVRVSPASRNTYTEEVLSTNLCQGVSFMKDSDGNTIVLWRDNTRGTLVRRYDANGLKNSDVLLPMDVLFPVCTYQENYFNHDNVLRWSGYVSDGAGKANYHYAAINMSEIWKHRSSFCSIPWKRLTPGPQAARKYPLYGAE